MSQLKSPPSGNVTLENSNKSKPSDGGSSSSSGDNSQKSDVKNKSKNKNRHASASAGSHSRSESTSSSHHKNNSTPTRETKTKQNKEEKNRLQKPRLPLHKTPQEQDQSKTKVVITVANTPRTISQIVVIQKYFRRLLAQRELEKRLAWQAYRTKVVNEIITTEVNYVKVLQQLVNDFLIPLRNAAASESTAIISKQDVQAMFPYIDILYNINKQFLLDLQARQNVWSSTQKIGDIFLKMSDFLRSYTIYVENYATVTMTVDACMKQESFRKYLKAKLGADDPLLLTSLLITPIQRITRYQLLLEQLKKKTWPSHCDYNNICRSLAKMKETADYVNVKAREAECTAKVIEIENSLVGKFKTLISPQRKFVREGVLLELIKGKLQERRFFLFNDVLVRAKRAKSDRRLSLHDVVVPGITSTTTSTPTGVSSTSATSNAAPSPSASSVASSPLSSDRSHHLREKWEFLEKVPLRDISVINRDDEGEIKNLFEITHPKITYLVSAATPEEKNAWMTDLTTHAKECQEKAKFYQEEKMRIARERANQAKALIGKQYLSLKHGIQPWRDKPETDTNTNIGAFTTDDVEDVELGKRSSRQYSHSFSASSPGGSTSFDANTAPSGSLRKYKQHIYRNMTPQERYQEMLQATEDIEKLQQEEKRREEEKLAAARSRAEKNKELLEKKFGSLKAGQLKDYKSLKAEMVSQRLSMGASVPNMRDEQNSTSSASSKK
jgi:hypothetical protein